MKNITPQAHTPEEIQRIRNPAAADRQTVWRRCLLMALLFCGSPTKKKTFSKP
jgi:hypothetical protein